MPSPTLGTISECPLHHRERSVDLKHGLLPLDAPSSTSLHRILWPSNRLFFTCAIIIFWCFMRRCKLLLWGQKSLLLFPVLAMRTLSAHVREFYFVGSFPLHVLHPPQGQEGAHPLQCPTHLEGREPWQHLSSSIVKWKDVQAQILSWSNSLLVHWYQRNYAEELIHNFKWNFSFILKTVLT